MAADGGRCQAQQLAHTGGADRALGQDNLQHPVPGALALSVDRARGGHVKLAGGIHNP
ncbi:hypothetical protein GCM10010977_26660 [Citricoccus zhacaiensis]|uniref:Uncharacterized protein n=1 Tax=Citricoccus zhacaiensis TaxID=489142 RepID=A0ABQ2M8J6_9MICC|nr:hypothetical protein GCM10010977_26660 [Citricoccus zhacaiensis]